MEIFNLQSQIPRFPPEAFPKFLILHGVQSHTSDQLIFILRNPPDPDPPLLLDHCFPFYFRKMDLVGSVNGVVCLSHPPWGDCIVLWNPATRKSEFVRPSPTKPVKGVSSNLSIGFGLDPQENDFYVVSILCSEPELNLPNSFEIYSENKGFWKKMGVVPGIQFLGTKCGVVVKGVPYWIALVDDVLGMRNMLIYFDVLKGVFCKMPMPGIDAGTGKCIVEFKEYLAMIVWKESEKQYFDLWFMDEENGWSKKFSVGPILDVERVVGCSRDVEIVLKNEVGKLIFYDAETKGTRSFSIGSSVKGMFEVSSYKESLVCMKGGRITDEWVYRRMVAAREFLRTRFGFNIELLAGEDPVKYDQPTFCLQEL